MNPSNKQTKKKFLTAKETPDEKINNDSYLEIFGEETFKKPASILDFQMKTDTYSNFEKPYQVIFNFFVLFKKN